LPWLTVVGEIGDVKQMAADEPTVNQFYLPASHVKAAVGSFATAAFRTGNAGTIVLRSQLPPEQMTDPLRTVVRSIDPQLPLSDIESMDRVVAEGQASRRFNTVLISSFAAAAVLLDVLGVYSVIAFSAARYGPRRWPFVWRSDRSVPASCASSLSLASNLDWLILALEHCCRLRHPPVALDAV
jgi:hypothetical protein